MMGAVETVELIKVPAATSDKLSSDLHKHVACAHTHKHICIQINVIKYF